MHSLNTHLSQALGAEPHKLCHGSLGTTLSRGGVDFLSLQLRHREAGHLVQSQGESGNQDPPQTSLSQETSVTHLGVLGTYQNSGWLQKYRSLKLKRHFVKSQVGPILATNRKHGGHFRSPEPPLGAEMLAVKGVTVFPLTDLKDRAKTTDNRRSPNSSFHGCL